MNEFDSDLINNLPMSDILGKEISRGGNSICYESKIDSNQIVLEIGGNWGGTQNNESQQRMQETLDQEIKLFKQIPDHINAPKILGYKIENGKLYKFMEKVPGSPAQERNSSFNQWKESLIKLANLPEHHYQKLVSDIKKLATIGLQADPSKPDNFYYDEQSGFQLIDLNVGNYDASADLLDPLLYTYNLFTKYQGQIDPEVKNAIAQIIAKLDQAQANLRENKVNDIKAVIK